MLRYETLFLTVPEITVDEASTIESQLEKAVADSNGSVISYERWGKYNLAYPVRSYDYGIYFLMRFEVSEENKSKVLKEIQNTFAVKQSDLVMREITVRIPVGKSLDYNRPESLEEVPTRDVDTFLKENKMSGLLNKSASQGAAHEADLDLDEDLMVEDETEE
jgi:ribosomal protein S6